MSKELCQFHKKNETIVGLDAHHMGLHKVAISSDAFRILSKILMNVAKEAPARLAKKNEICKASTHYYITLS